MASGLKWNSLLYLHTTTFLSRCLAQEHKSINTNTQTHTINNTKTSAQHTSTKGSLTGSSETHYWITTTFLSHCRRDISRLKAVEGINFFSEMCPLYLCVHVFVYMWIFKVYFSTRGRSKHQLPLKNVSSPRWEALRPKFEPFFPAAAQTLSILQHVEFHSILQLKLSIVFLQFKLSVLYFTAWESIAVRLASLDPNIDTQWTGLVQQGQKGACRILLFQFLLSPLYRSSMFHPFSPPRKHRSMAQQYANC